MKIWKYKDDIQRSKWKVWSFVFPMYLFTELGATQNSQQTWFYNTSRMGFGRIFTLLILEKKMQVWIDHKLTFHYKSADRFVGHLVACPAAFPAETAEERKSRPTPLISLRHNDELTLLHLKQAWKINLEWLISAKCLIVTFSHSWTAGDASQYIVGSVK